MFYAVNYYGLEVSMEIHPQDQCQELLWGKKKDAKFVDIINK